MHTPFGQLHARVCGEGEPVVLLHLTPGSGAQFDAIMPVLAERGYQGWALDVLGNGRSDPQPDDYTFEMAALAIGHALDDAGLAEVKLVGGHMSAQMAVQLVAQRSELATHLVIDGLPMWDRATREHIIGMFDNTAPVPNEDGSHILEAWTRTLHLQRAWNADLTIDAESEPRMRRALIDALEAGLDSQIGARAFLEFDVHAPLQQLSLPVLVTTASGDTLADQHAPTVAAIKGAKEHHFEGTHPRHIPARAAEYVTALDNFFRS